MCIERWKNNESLAKRKEKREGNETTIGFCLSVTTQFFNGKKERKVANGKSVFLWTSWLHTNRKQTMKKEM